ncbi:MAG: HupE/UreJ family protein, partial [Flavobacteriales bacterium]
MSDFVLGLTHITDWEGYDHMLYLLALVAAYDLRHIGKAALTATAFTLGH